ncbi:carboxypeptidase-like regulatory domain-containing protein [Actinomadura madurae]|nr:carboxypeptidase-like regulatory domain-containing protein [Actinomadura madurae]
MRGVVRTRDGEPVPSAALTLIGVDGHQLARAITQEDGRYALPTPGPGSYVLIAATGGHEPQAATLVVGDRPVEFDLLLAAAAASPERSAVGTAPRSRTRWSSSPTSAATSSAPPAPAATGATCSRTSRRAPTPSR